MSRLQYLPDHRDDWIAFHLRSHRSGTDETNLYTLDTGHQTSFLEKNAPGCNSLLQSYSFHIDPIRKYTGRRELRPVGLNRCPKPFRSFSDQELRSATTMNCNWKPYDCR